MPSKAAFPSNFLFLLHNCSFSIYFTLLYTWPQLKNRKDLSNCENEAKLYSQGGFFSYNIFMLI